MRDLRIRLATDADAAACAEVLRASIRDLCTPDHHGDQERIAAWCANKTPERVAAWIAGGGRLFLAEAEGEVLGVAAFDGSEVTLNYVAPPARFRGVSTALLARLEAELAANGVVEARLDSTRTAHAFYLARGWRDSIAPVEWLGMPGYPMTKPIG